MAEELLSEALLLATPCRDECCTLAGHPQCGTACCTAPGHGLFVVQSVARKWENHANLLDRCLVLGDRPRRDIYLARSGHSRTGRTQGMLVHTTKEVAADDAKWKRAMEWTMADLGLRNCLIFRTEILGMEGEEVLFSPLQAYTKDATTILAAYNKPCELHQGAPDPREVLPPTRHVEWVWRTRKTQRIGVARPSCELVEVPEMAAGRRLSTLSTRGRLQRRLELEEAELRLDWEDRMGRIVERHRALAEARARELEQLEATIQERRRALEQRTATRRVVEKALLEGTKKIAELTGKILDILGVRATQTGRRRIVLQEAEDGPIVCVWATKGLERILDNQAGAFAAQPNQYGRLLQWLPNRESKLQIHVQEPKTFWKKEGTRIAWNPIFLLATPKAEDLQELQRLLEAEENRRTVLETEGMEEPPRLVSGQHHHQTSTAKRHWRCPRGSIS